MLTRIDHVMICPPRLDEGIEAYRRLGFDIYPGGVSSNRGTHNAIAFHGDDYLELASVSDRATYLAASPRGGLVDFLDRGGGFGFVCVESGDLPSGLDAIAERGGVVVESRG